MTIFQVMKTKKTFSGGPYNYSSLYGNIKFSYPMVYVVNVKMHAYLPSGGIMDWIIKEYL